MDKKNLLAFFIVLFFSLGTLHAQSDEPCDATQLTVGAGGICSNGMLGCINPPAFTNSTSASSGVMLPDYTAGGFDTSTRDFWYKAVVPSGGKLNVRVTSGGSVSQSTPLWDMALYTSSNPSTCAGSTFTLVAADSSITDYPDLTVALPAGTVVYIRMWRPGSDQAANRCYTICATAPPTSAPACTTVIEPASGATDVLAPYTRFRWTSVASASSYVVYLSSNSTPDSLTEINDTTVRLATAYNTKYYYRIVPKNAAGMAIGCAVDSFTTMDVPPIPANDSCQGAIGVAASAPENGTTFGATQSLAASSCQPFTGAVANDDVWYKFTAVNNGNATIRLINRTGGEFDPVIIGYSGDCNGLVQIACADSTGAGGNESINFTGLIADTTYYFRIYGYGPFGTEGNFTLTAAGSALPPAFYRTIASGSWNDVNIWEASTDSAVWFAAALPPTDASKTITIQTGNSVNVTEDLTIDETDVQPGGMLTVASGRTLNIINNGLTLRSDADKTGMVGQSAGTINGDAVVERFIPARRAWRFLCPPVSTTMTIHDTWQERGDSIPGYGTHITGGPAVNGFDQSPTNGSSIKVYVSNRLQNLSSTNLSLNTYPAYMMFIRGDRTINLAQGASAPPTNTILRSIGSLNTGMQPGIVVSDTAFTAIANPYASPIDFTLIARNLVPDRFWLWDPKRSTYGAWVLFDAANGYTPLTSGGSYAGANTLIQTGQAFLVHGDSVNSGMVAIDEVAKVTTQRNVFRPGSTNDQKLQVNLHFYNPDNSTTVADAAMTAYNDTYSAAINGQDAFKLDNIDENIAILRNNKLLTIERRPLGSSDTIFLKVYNTNVKNYMLEILPSNFGSANMQAFLQDGYLNTTTPIDLNTTTQVNFSVTSNAASADPYRFKIILRPAGTLPVDITTIKAYRKNTGVEVNWNVLIERQVQSYVVERSANGERFERVAEIAPKNNRNGSGDYTWYDPSPFKGISYYRIKTVEATGMAKFSSIANVRIDNGVSDIVVYPNPVRNRRMTLQFNDREKGNYSIQLFNNAGQQVFNRIISHPGGSAVQTISLNSNVTAGTYNLVVNKGDDASSQSIVVE